VVSFSTDAHTHSGCFGEGMAVATPESIKMVTRFVDSLIPDGGTSYVMALKKAFLLLKNSPSMLSKETSNRGMLLSSEYCSYSRQNFKNNYSSPVRIWNSGKYTGCLRKKMCPKIT
jgi:hypothetical protein